MNRESVQNLRAYFDLVNGVTLRLIGAFADEDLDFRPRPGLRSPRELIYHIYAMEKGMAEHLKSGRLPLEVENRAVPEAEEAKPLLAELKTVADLQAFARDAHAAANEAVAALTDEDLKSVVEAPYGSFPAWQFLQFANDEHWHHRGQLCTYLRLLGKEVPFLYDYQS